MAAIGSSGVPQRVSTAGSAMHESGSCLPRTLQDIAAAGLPDELSGQAGSNRDYEFEPLIAAQTDSQAIFAWLDESPDGSSTRRAYEKEVQRLYAWALAYAGKPIGVDKDADIPAFGKYWVLNAQRIGDDHDAPWSVNLHVIQFQDRAWDARAKQRLASGSSTKTPSRICTISALDVHHGTVSQQPLQIPR